MSASDWDGLFPPDSVSWRVGAEPVLFVAGLRALYLQALHPAALAGVLVHSDFRADPWGRLIRTAEYVGTVTFGSRAEVEAVTQRVRGLHEKVSGADPATGTRYRASDPALLTWVHCCEVDSFLAVARRAGTALSPAEADRYVAEQVRAVELLGVDPGLVPASVGELEAYFHVARRDLRATARTRRIAGYVLVPPMPAWVSLTPARPGWLAVAGLAFASLPRWARRLYGVPANPLTDVAVTATLRGLRLGLDVLPQALREGPHLRAARVRAALLEAA